VTDRLAVIVGVGGALGPALVQLLSAKGYSLVGISRSGKFESIGVDPRQPEPLEIFAGDVVDPNFMQATQAKIVANYGEAEVLIYNAHQLLISSFADTSSDQFEQLWRSNVFGAFLAAKAFIPSMLKSEKGTIIFSGATGSIRGSAKFSAFAASKFALRGLGQSLAREYAPLGIHVAHVVIDGLIWGDKARDFHKVQRDQCIEPEQVAKTYINLIEQDPSAWTQELDLRPRGGKF
jgi:NAD(P)-dependent dehydrogenase (short-subunit alcohol dehydrogenase family)